MSRRWGSPAKTGAATEGGYDFGPDDAAVVLRRHTEILELIAAAAPLGVMLDRIVEAIEELIPGADASILLLDRAGRQLRHGAARRLPSAYLLAIDGLRPGPSAGSCGTAAFLNTRVVSPDVRTDPRWDDFREAAAEAGLVACWSTPIAGQDGGAIGTFALYHRTPHVPSAREIRLVDRFSYLASVAIEHSRAVGDLVESEELFRRSFDDNAAGMALLGLDLSIQRVNAAMVDLTGYASDELSGQPITLVLREAATCGQTVEALLDGRLGRVTKQMRLQNRNGDELTVETTASLIRGIDGTPRLFVITLLDLTERQAVARAEQGRREAEIARRTAEEHSRAKSELLTAVSHEVRSPLQAITGFTELLSTLDLDASRREEALRQINKAAQHLLSLVTDVLDISRVEAAALPLRLEPVHVAEAVRDALELVAAEAASREVTIQARTHSDSMAYVDRRRLVQIVLNLLGNAARHGRPGGHVEVIVEDVPSPPPGAGQSVGVTIADDGPGIPEDVLGHLFTPFVRGTASEVDGYGLGLVLAASLAQAMGGELSVRNQPRGGARFDLRLPKPGAGGQR